MTPEQITAAEARLAELNEQNTAFRKDIDRCLEEIGRLRVEYLKAQDNLAVATDSATSRLAQAERAAQALVEQASVAANKARDEARMEYDLALKTAQSPVQGFLSTMRSLDEQRQLTATRRSLLKEEYDAIYQAVGQAKKAAEKAAE